MPHTATTISNIFSMDAKRRVQAAAKGAKTLDQFQDRLTNNPGGFRAPAQWSVATPSLTPVAQAPPGYRRATILDARYKHGEFIPRNRFLD